MQQFKAIEYLKIDIANSFGLDKAEWDDRIAWFDKNQEILETLEKQAEEPALFFAGVQAFRKAQQGLPSGYPISLDATASGIQLLAILTGDRRACEMSNVVATGKREDAYTVIWKALQELVGEAVRVTRTQAKEAVVPALYGSEERPRKIFGENLLARFEETMWSLAPAAWDLNKSFLDMWRPDVNINSWVLPDNFHVHVKVVDAVSQTVNFLNKPYQVTRYVNQPTSEGRSLGANTIHSLDGFIVREMARRCMYDPDLIGCVRNVLNGGMCISVSDQDTDMMMTLWRHYKKSGFLSARILDYIGDDNVHLIDVDVVLGLIDSLPAKPFQILTVHDCFRCLPAYGNDLRQQYVNLLYRIAKSNMLSFLLEQITGHECPVDMHDPTVADDILSSEYALS